MKKHSVPVGGFNYFHIFTSPRLENTGTGCEACFITIIGENGERLQKWLMWANPRQEEVRRR